MSSLPALQSSALESFNNLQRSFEHFFNRDIFHGHKLMNCDWSPSVDIVTKDGAYLLNVDLPGVDPKDVEVTVDHGQLSIYGERRKQKSEDRDGEHITETSYGSFARSFTLPAGVTSKDIKASTKNGVLQIEVPKGKEAHGERVKIAVS